MVRKTRKRLPGHVWNHCNDMVKFLKTWMLPLCMIVGASSYLIYAAVPSLAPAGPFLDRAVSIIQPVLIFVMLFLTFIKVSPRDLRPRKWQKWLLLVQTGSFAGMAAVIYFLPENLHESVLIESAMLCMVCPTATAAAVVTGKLGGDIPGITSYTVLINLAVAFAVPFIVPAIHPQEGVNFFTASAMIMAKVFPMLICPCLLAWIVRFLMPRLHRRLMRYPDLAFYIWGVSLALAIAVTTRSIVHSPVPAAYQAGIAAISLGCCIVQFIAGRRIGRAYGDSVTAGQALGQKNTVFAIWMGYTFMTPVTSIAGGFYCIWHNLFNSWQLYIKDKEEGR